METRFGHEPECIGWCVGEEFLLDLCNERADVGWRARPEDEAVARVGGGGGWGCERARVCGWCEAEEGAEDGVGGYGGIGEEEGGLRAIACGAVGGMEGALEGLWVLEAAEWEVGGG